MDHERAGERVPEQQQPVAPAPAPAGGFWRGASNAAVAAMVARSPTATAGHGTDRAAMQAIEQSMVSVKTGARTRAASFNTLSDQSIQALRDADRHLRDSNANYRTAYDAFTAKLNEADARFETEQAIKDAVQGILVAAALAAVGPELLVVKGGTALVEATAATTARAIARAGFAGGAGEIAEMGGGAVAGGARGPAVRPGSTAAGGGPTTGDKFEEAFGKLSELIGVMPKLGTAATASMNIALFAGEIETEAVRVGGGGSGRWSAAEITEKSTVAQTANTDAQASVQPAENAAARVRVLKEQITSAPVKPAEDIERLIWTNWMASLSGDANEVLDNDVIQDYLTSKGLIAPGSYMSDSDQADAVTNARKEVLRQRGINADGPGVAIDSIYRREMKLDELRRRLLNKRGRISAPNTLAVDGRTYDSPGQVGGAALDTEVTVTHIIVKPHMQGLTINLAEWRDGEFDVMGVPVADLQAAQAQAPADLPPQPSVPTTP